MKHLGLVHILLLLGVGLSLGLATAELTAYQDLVPSANVGQTVSVTVSLVYNGLNSTQAVVTPSLPYGVVANAAGQSTELYPGVMQQISYSLAAQQSGTYWIVSDISYAEDGTWRNLRLEAPFTAIGGVEPQPGPGETTPGTGTPGIGPNGSSNPVGTDPFATPPGGVLPSGVSPHDTQPINGTPGNEFPEGGAPDGFNPAQDQGMPGQGERPPGSQ